MRPSILLSLALLPLAGSAGAQARKTFTVPAATKPAVAAPSTAAPPAPLTPGLDPRGPILPPVSGPVGGVAQQCRTNCAQTYYFCLSDGRADDCSTTWGQCRVACGAGDRAGY